MAASRKRVFARNITSNLAGYAVSAVVALFLSPFVVSALGGLHYGLWTLLVSLTGYYGLLDLGVRSAVGQYVTRYWARDDMVGVSRTFSTSMVLLCGVAFVGILVTLGLTWYLPSFLEANNTGETALEPAALEVLIHDARIAMMICGGGIALGIPMALWATATYAQERFDISNAVGIAERLILAALIVWTLQEGHGVIGLAAVTVGTQFLASTARMIIAYKLMPGLSVSIRNFAKESVRELWNYGIFNFMVNAADRVVLYMDAIVVTTFIGLAAVTPYEIGAKLIPYFMSLVLAITWTMTPYATACDARGDMDALRRLLLKGTRGSLFIASVICAGLLLAGDEFLLIWMDPQFLDEGTSYAIMAVLAWATLARASTSCGRQILFGMRRMKLLASLAFAEAGLNIGLSIVLVQHYGLIGVAWGTLISIVVAYVITQNVFIVRLTGVSGHHYLWQILRATVPVIGSMYLVSLWTDTWLVVNSWSWFGVEVLLLMVPVIPIGYLLVMNEDEREIIKRRLPFRRK